VVTTADIRLGRRSVNLPSAWVGESDCLPLDGGACCDTPGSGYMEARQVRLPSSWVGPQQCGFLPGVCCEDGTPVKVVYRDVLIPTAWLSGEPGCTPAGGACCNVRTTCTLATCPGVGIPEVLYLRPMGSSSPSDGARPDPLTGQDATIRVKLRYTVSGWFPEDWDYVHTSTGPGDLEAYYYYSEDGTRGLPIFALSVGGLPFFLWSCNGEYQGAVGVFTDIVGGVPSPHVPVAPTVSGHYLPGDITCGGSGSGGFEALIRRSSGLTTGHVTFDALEEP
jgi:hypothetical protein